MHSDNKLMLNEFGHAIQNVIKPIRTFIITSPASGRSIPSDLFDEVQAQERKTFLELTLDEEPADLIFGSIPFGLRSPAGFEFQTNNTDLELIHALSKHLTENGIGIFQMVPVGFGSNAGQRFVERMRNDGLHVIAYISLPEKIFERDTYLTPVLAIISRTKKPLRLARLDRGSNYHDLARQLLLDNVELTEVEHFQGTQFFGFNSIRIQKEINALNTRYKSFSAQPLSQLIVEYRRSRPTHPFEDSQNCIYLKLLGSNSEIFTSVPELTGRAENYIQLRLTPEISNSFLKIFFQSKLGALILKSSKSNSIMPRINMEYLLNTNIPFPPITTQKQIAETEERLARLEADVTTLRKEISLNPTSANMSEKIDAMLAISGELTEEERIKSLIYQGENAHTEFKQTFQHCLRERKKADYVETAALKTIAAFLNSKGGCLLVGIADDGQVMGIDFELKKYHQSSSDKFLLHLKDKIKSRIGMTPFSFLEINLSIIEDKTVLVVDCQPSDQEIFVDNKDFYVRTSPATEKLEGRQFTNYIRTRFIG